MARWRHAHHSLGGGRAAGGATGRICSAATARIRAAAAALHGRAVQPATSCSIPGSGSSGTAAGPGPM